MTQPSDPRKVAAGGPARPVKVIVELIDHTSAKVANSNRITMINPTGLALPNSGPVLRGASSCASNRVNANASVKLVNVILDSGEQVGLRQPYRNP